MRKVILSIFASFCLKFSFAQTPFSIVSLDKDKAGIDAAGPRSVWAGAQATYNLTSGEFVDNFQASGRALIEVLGPKTDRYGIFLMGNLSRLSINSDSADANIKYREILQSSQGINISLYPHYIWGDPNENSFTLYANIGWKLNALKDNEDLDLIYMHQFRVAPIAFELTGLKGLYSNYPTSLTVEPALSFISKSNYSDVFSKSGSTVFGLNTTLIFPAGKGRGIIVDAMFSKNIDPTFRVGLMLTSGN